MADLASFRALGLEHGGRRSTGISEPEIVWLLRAVPGIPVRRSLEVGLGIGYSAAALLHAGVEEHISIDFNAARLTQAEANARRAMTGNQRLSVLEGWSHCRLAEMHERREKVDLMLVDGGHRFDDAFVDVHFARFLVAPGGVLVLDDVHLNGVRAVMSWLETNMRHLWTPTAAPERFRRAPAFGFAIYRRTDARDDARKPGGNRPWDRHRRFETFEDQN